MNLRHHYYTVTVGGNQFVINQNNTSLEKRPAVCVPQEVTPGYLGKIPDGTPIFDSYILFGTKREYPPDTQRLQVIVFSLSAIGTSYHVGLAVDKISSPWRGEGITQHMHLGDISLKPRATYVTDPDSNSLLLLDLSELMPKLLHVLLTSIHHKPAPVEVGDDLPW